MAELSSYLLQQNRPFNNTNLVDSMAAKLKVGKTAVTKALDTLESESLVQVCCRVAPLIFMNTFLDILQVKEFGKVKIYLAKQDSFEVPSAEELAEMDNQIASLKEQLAAASEQHKVLQAELKGVESALSDEQLQLQISEYKTVSDALEQKLKSLQNPEPGAPPPISAEEMSRIEKTSVKFSTEWKKRKRICYDVLNKFSEQNGKKVRVIGEEIGIEFDEDVGAVLSPTPTVSAISRGPPSAMAGRVYPPSVPAKTIVPGKVAPVATAKSAAVTAKSSVPVAKTPPVASVKPVAASKAGAKATAPKPAVASKKTAASDSDSDSGSSSESESPGPKTSKTKPSAASKAVTAAPKGKVAAKSIAAKPASKPAAATKKAAKSKKKKDSDSESSFSSDESESSDSDSSPIVESVASKKPRAAAAKASASKKAKSDSDSDFEK
jgi:26S proteasome regulatory subunit (ATPase 3-interacting protein)